MSDQQIYTVVKQLSEAFRTGRKRPDEIARPILYVEIDKDTSVNAESIMFDSFKDSTHLYIKRFDDREQSETSDDENIDLDRHTQFGADQALDVLQRQEEDSGILRLVEFMLENEPVYENYERMKHEFLESYHVENRTSQSGELLQHCIG